MAGPDFLPLVVCTGLPDHLRLLAHAQHSAAERLPGLAADHCHLAWSISPENKVREKLIRNLLVVNDYAE